jgi:hypothetical protein
MVVFVQNLKILKKECNRWSKGVRVMFGMSEHTDVLDHTFVAWQPDKWGHKMFTNWIEQAELRVWKLVLVSFWDCPKGGMEIREKE